VRIESDLPTSQYPNAAGFALPFPESGVNVEIFYRRVERQASAVGVGTDALLAYTLTHEIGTYSSDRQNTRRPVLCEHAGTATVFGLASAGLLPFLPEQAKQMQKRVEQLERDEGVLSAATVFDTTNRER
jgi:hypothetical protein